MNSRGINSIACAMVSCDSKAFDLCSKSIRVVIARRVSVIEVAVSVILQTCFVHEHGLVSLGETKETYGQRVVGILSYCFGI